MPIRVKITVRDGANEPAPSDYVAEVKVDDFGPGETRTSFPADIALTGDSREVAYVANSANPAAPNSRTDGFAILWSNQTIPGTQDGATFSVQLNCLGTTTPRIEAIGFDRETAGSFSIDVEDFDCGGRGSCT